MLLVLFIAFLLVEGDLQPSADQNLEDQLNDLKKSIKRSVEENVMKNDDDITVEKREESKDKELEDDIISQVNGKRHSGGGFYRIKFGGGFAGLDDFGR